MRVKGLGPLTRSNPRAKAPPMMVKTFWTQPLKLLPTSEMKVKEGKISKFFNRSSERVAAIDVTTSYLNSSLMVSHNTFLCLTENIKIRHEAEGEIRSTFQTNVGDFRRF